MFLFSFFHILVSSAFLLISLVLFNSHCFCLGVCCVHYCFILLFLCRSSCSSVSLPLCVPASVPLCIHQFCCTGPRVNSFRLYNSESLAVFVFAYLSVCLHPSLYVCGHLCISASLFACLHPSLYV